MDESFAALTEDVKTIAVTMREGFARMDMRFEAVDKRFESTDKRFEDMNKRFNSLVVLMSVFFTVLAGMMTALRLFV